MTLPPCVVLFLLFLVSGFAQCIAKEPTTNLAFSIGEMKSKDDIPIPTTQSKIQVDNDLRVAITESDFETKPFEHDRRYHLFYFGGEDNLSLRYSKIAQLSRVCVWGLII
eukprot:246954_1